MPFEIPAVDPCSLCAYIWGRAPWEPLAVDEHAATFMNVRQRSIGSVLVAPVRHVSTLAELAAVEVAAMGRHVRHAALGVTKTFDPDGLHVWCGGGVLAGQSEPHVHFQVVPRYAGAEYSFAPSNELARSSRAERLELASRITAAASAHFSVPAGAVATNENGKEADNGEPEPGGERG
jgi:diadenosine tetraphosphate (Ap4A) HIT family hydrolase